MKHDTMVKNMRKSLIKSIMFGSIIIPMLSLFLISIVKAPTPPVVRNLLEINPPFGGGVSSHDGGTQGVGSNRHDANIDLISGNIYILSETTAGPPYGSSAAWAQARVGSRFSIVHSSFYDATLKFEYKGKFGATAVAYIAGYAESYALIQLIASIYDETSLCEVASKTEIIQEYLCKPGIIPKDPIEISGVKDVVLSSVNLQAGHEYSVQGEAYVKTYAITSVAGASGAWSNFWWEDGYYVRLTKATIRDLYPDAVSPTTSASLSGTAGDNGWYKSEVTITLTATDDGQPAQNIYGVDYTNYKVDDGSWALYSSAFRVSSDGKHKVYYYSVDKAGIKEAEKSIDIWIDTVSPAGLIKINDNAQYTTSTSVTLTPEAVDGTGSGVAQMRFRNEGGNWASWQSYTTTSVSWTLTSGDGNKRVYVQFKDNAGNISPESYDDTILDTTSPDMSNLQQDPSGREIQPNQAMIVSVDVTDAQSGVNHVTLSYRTSSDNVMWSNWIGVTMNKLAGNTWSATIPGFGPQTHVQYKISAYDNANNMATTPIGAYYYFLVVPEFPAFVTLLLLMALTALAFILAKKKFPRKLES